MRSPKPAFDLRAALAREILGALDELERAVEKHKALHRCRIHLKRARALARIGRACAPGLSEVFNDAARGVMRLLAPQRDLHALARSALALRKNTSRKSAAALAGIADRLELERTALPALNTEATRAGLKDLLALAQVWPEASDRQIRRGAERIVKRARGAYRAARKRPDADHLHEWRKREKDRQYAALILAEHWPQAERRKTSAALTDMLGRSRDASLLLQKLRSEPTLAGEGKAPLRAERALKRGLRRMRGKEQALGARLHAGGA